MTNLKKDLVSFDSLYMPIFKANIFQSPPIASTEYLCVLALIAGRLIISILQINMSVKMKAVGYQKSLPTIDSHCLLDIELGKPVASGRDILVKVEAISVNPVDTKIRKNVTPDEHQHKILGWDVSGVVESIGEEVSLFNPGDEVWYAGAIDRPGANSEYHLVDERIVSQKPKSLSFEEAAALPLTSITAWEILFERLNINTKTKGSLLIIGAAGGVGSILIQLARQLTQLTIIATASRPETKKWVTSLGAHYVIDHTQALSKVLPTDIKSVEYIASLTHTEDHLSEIVEIISPQGHLAVIDDPKTLNVMPFKTKSASIHWELMFTRSLFETNDMIEQHKLLAQVSKMVDDGIIKSTALNNIGLINAANLIKAHALLESGKSIGKVVLKGF
jgi:zinc-binding alcohol dehydrogenase family protein